MLIYSGKDGKEDGQRDEAAKEEDSNTNRIATRESRVTHQKIDE